MKVPRSGFIRIASVEPCDVEYHAGRRTVMTWDLSVLGVYLVIDPIPEVGERIRISFRLPDDPDPIHAEGRVTWQNPPSTMKHVATRVVDLPPGCGVEFLALAEEDRRRIQAHVDATAGQP